MKLLIISGKIVVGDREYPDIAEAIKGAGNLVRETDPLDGSEWEFVASPAHPGTALPTKYSPMVIGTRGDF